MWSMALSGMLRPVLDSPVREGCWETGLGEGYQDVGGPWREAEGVVLSGCRQGGSGWRDSSRHVLEGDLQRQWSFCMSSL